VCPVALLKLRLAAASVPEGERVLGQPLTGDLLLHSLEELQPKVRRLAEHVDEHEPVGSTVTDFRPAGNALPLEDGAGIGQYRGSLGIVVGREECLDELFYARC
jgi:hypothetical protein